MIMEGVSQEDSGFCDETPLLSAGYLLSLRQKDLYIVTGV